MGTSYHLTLRWRHGVLIPVLQHIAETYDITLRVSAPHIKRGTGSIERLNGTLSRSLGESQSLFTRCRCDLFSNGLSPDHSRKAAFIIKKQPSFRSQKAF